MKCKLTAAMSIHEMRISTVALVSTTIAASMIAGCATIMSPLAADYDSMGGKVVRVKADMAAGLYGAGDAESSFHAKFLNGKLIFEVYGGRKPTATEVLPYRWSRVSVPGAWKAGGINGPLGGASVIVADGVPLLRNGDWVDVYVPQPLRMADRRWLTVVRVVCKAEDTSCQEKEAANGGKPRGQAVADSYDESLLVISPHYDMAGNWLPGKQPPQS